jgi:transposase-like protein
MKTLKMKADESGLAQLAEVYGDEPKARQLLESLRWPDGPVCPHCQNAGQKRISKLQAHTASPRGVRDGVYFCGACRQQFTVTVGTVLAGSHVPISKWLMALFLLCSSRKSLSANQIHRMIGVTYKTAWFLCHRIRFTEEISEGFGSAVDARCFAPHVRDELLQSPPQFRPSFSRHGEQQRSL